MAYIYKITNIINHKAYVGKTESSIEKRFQEHCADAFRAGKKKRPLYSAMRKYGVENFSIELIEETDNPEEREIFWIEQLQTYKNGYNATRGGDGRKYIDYDKVVALYLEYQNCKTVAKIMNIGCDTVSTILHSRKIDVISSQEIAKNANKKFVAMFDSVKFSEPLFVFDSYSDAARYIVENGLSSTRELRGVAVHIRDACLGRRKTAYKFFWKLL